MNTFCVWPGCYEHPIDNFLCADHLPLRNASGHRAETARYRIRAQQKPAAHQPVPTWGPESRTDPDVFTAADYQERFHHQGGLCAICRLPPKKERLVVDHVHGHPGPFRASVRGLLCRRCNLWLGLFEQAPWLLAGLANFCRQHTILLDEWQTVATAWIEGKPPVPVQPPVDVNAFILRKSIEARALTRTVEKLEEEEQAHLRMAHRRASPGDWLDRGN
jgi:recombination endonuclease VII